MAVGYSNEAELPVSPWQTCEEDPELSTPTDAVADSDARHWLQLSPTDASNLTGNCVWKGLLLHTGGPGDPHSNPSAQCNAMPLSTTLELQLQSPAHNCLSVLRVLDGKSFKIRQMRKEACHATVYHRKKCWCPLPRSLEAENIVVLACMYHTCRTGGLAILLFTFLIIIKDFIHTMQNCDIYAGDQS